MTPALRPATPDDWPAMAALVAACFQEYRSFAPPDWVPPGVEQELGHLSKRLAGARSWARVAEEDGRLVAHLAMHPAPEELGVLHVMHLFLAPEVRGTGLAQRLLQAAVDEAIARDDVRELRLNTPEGQQRARRFYVRQGWEEARRYDVPSFGLPLVEYRRSAAATASSTR